MNHPVISYKVKPRLSDEEIELVADTQIEFVSTIMPYLEDGHGYRINYQDKRESLQLELRSLKRFDPKPLGKSRGTERYKSLNTFNLSESTKAYWVKYLRECNRARTQNCQYFILSMFDKAIKPKKLKDIENIRGALMCNSENAALLMCYMLDFDNVSKREFVEQYAKLKELGISGNVVFTGHGYQVYITLTETTRDLHSFKAFVKLAKLRGFNVDAGACSVSQLARMPETFNSKAYDPKYKKEKEVIQTKWLIKSDNRYSIEELFAKMSDGRLNSETVWDYLGEVKPLPPLTSDEEFKAKEIRRIESSKRIKKAVQKMKLEEDKKKTEESTSNLEGKSKKKEENKRKTEAKREQIIKNKASKLKQTDLEVSFVSLDLREIYPMIADMDAHSHGILNLLKGPAEGLANLGLKFLTAYFKSLDYDLPEIVALATIWQGLNTFDYAWDDEDFVKSEVERFYNNHYKMDKTDMPELEEFYGVLFQEDGAHYYLKDKVIFDNDNFCKLREIKPTAFLLLCSIKANDLREGTKYYTESDLSDLVLKTEKTVRTHMDKLVELGIAKVETRQLDNAKGGRPKKYYSLTDIDIEEIKYTQVDVSKIEALLFRTFKSKRVKKPLSDRAFMVALYIRYRAFGSKNSCYMKQANMAEEMGITRSMLSKAMTELEEHKLIRKQSHEVFSTLEYIIMY